MKIVTVSGRQLLETDLHPLRRHVLWIGVRFLLLSTEDTPLLVIWPNREDALSYLEAGKRFLTSESNLIFSGAGLVYREQAIWDFEPYKKEFGYHGPESPAEQAQLLRVIHGTIIAL